MAESTTKKQSVFEVLNAVNCKEHTESKGGLSYLSWAWAWAEVKKRFPGAFYTIYENDQHFPYFTDGRTAWVKTGVTIEGLELTEYLPVMDYKNNSIPVEKVTTMDVNKSIQRSLTKACARHGLGLYIYAGEDLPEGEPEKAAETPVEKPKPSRGRKTQAATEKAAQAPVPAQAKKTVTEENIKQLVEWVLKAPEGEQRNERVKKAEDSYEWPGHTLNLFFTMLDLQ